jgi:Dolichyl-phosphate-mannose-protein mannosyltransferase
MNKNKILSFINIRSIFLLALIIRLFLSPNNHVDDQRYLFLSDQILAGNYDMDAGSFLCAPFAPYFVAGFKYLFSEHWYTFLFGFQAFISALCVFSLYKIANLLFENKKTALLAAFIYAIYPDTFLYIRVVGQEVLFQSFLIFSIHFLIQFVVKKQNRDVYLSAIFFSLCFLTKSIVLGWSPFIVLFIFLNKTISLKTQIRASLIYAIVCLLFTMPIGFYNLLTHNQYTLSSNGGSFLFWHGNSEFAYVENIEKKIYNTAYPEQAAHDTLYQIVRLVPPTTNLNDYFVARKTWGTIQEIQDQFSSVSRQWVKDNPKKFWQLRAYNLFRFIFPGASPPNGSKIYVFFIFLSAGLLYFSAFLGLKTSLKKRFEMHNWLPSLWFVMLIFSIIFGTYTRFRTITIDSFLCVYAAFYINHLFEKIKPLGTFSHESQSRAFFDE